LSNKRAACRYGSSRDKRCRPYETAHHVGRGRPGRSEPENGLAGVNNAPHVQPELAERVLAAVAELGFRRDHLASSLRSGQATATIGLLIEEIANPFYATTTRS
jgi:hypothetical protein